MIVKGAIRAHSLKTLSLLPLERRKQASLNACSTLISHLEAIQGPILSFASKPLEINLWPLNEHLCKEGRLLLPKVEKGSLSIYKIEDLSQLQLSSFDFKEPNSTVCEKIPLEKVSAILVPGLGFDDNLHRVGYGKGYFDRFLSSFRFSCLKWGIGFTEQKVNPIPFEKHDIPLDAVFLF